MKKLIILFIILTLILSSNHLFAQQKYKIVEKEKWTDDFYFNFSYAGFIGKRIGSKTDLFFRYKYLNLGVGSFYSKNKDNENELIFYLPVGIYFPLKSKKYYTLGINTFYYLFTHEDKTALGNKLYESVPNIGELSLRCDTYCFSVSAGYRFQFGKWIEEEWYMYYDPNGLINLVIENKEVGRFDGIFIEISLGFSGWFGIDTKYGKLDLRKKKIIRKKIIIPNPSLHVNPYLSGKKNEIISGETKNLEVQINNKGNGLAEELEVKLLTNQYISTSSDRIYIGNLNPHSTRIIEIPITAKKVEDRTNVKLSLNLIEKDGFTANEEVEITILPEIQTEKFPPIFSINANLKEPNGNLLLDALEKGEIEITIKNTGRGNAWAVEPEIEIEQSHIINYLKFEKNLLTIRKIEPGGTEIVKIPIEADWDIPSGKVKMQIICREGNGFDSAPVNFSFEIQEFLEPELVITDVGIDDSESINTFGDGDNIIENMETIEVTAIVQNQGQGKAKDVKAQIIVNNENISYFGDELYSLGDFESGDFESLKFTILVNNKYSGGINLPININVTEHYKKYGITNKNLGLELNKITLASKDINIEGRKHIWQQIPKTPVLSVDIEKDFPKTEISRSEGIAVIIGNRDYEFYPDNPVEFAINDRNLAERYSKDVFGFRTVLGGENLGFAQFRNIFGTEDNPEGELYRTLRVEEPVFIYITGHGHSKPQLNQKAVSYIVPKDGNGYDLDATCYPIDNLYQNLSYFIERKKPEKLILIMDMCFSGYLTTAVSSARWESDNPLQDLIDIGKQSGTYVVCIFATQEAQTAKWYQEKKHGLLTYFVLKAFHNSENEGGYKADYNNDKKLKVGELKRFVLDENYGVPYFANQKEVVGNSDLGQLPVIIGDDEIILLEYK